MGFLISGPMRLLAMVVGMLTLVTPQQADASPDKLRILQVAQDTGIFSPGASPGVLDAVTVQLEQEQQSAEASAARRSQVGSADRSEKIRTYNFKENRVTDHRIGLTIHSLPAVLDGDLEDLHEALIADDVARKLAEG